MGAVPVHDRVRSPAGHFQKPSSWDTDYLISYENADTFVSIQNKQILERTLPDALKLAIAQKIENNLFSKV